MAARDIAGQIEKLLKPIRTRMANVVSRAVVQLVDDAKRQQMLQLGVLVGEDVDDAEHFLPYGFSCVPLAGAEGVALFPGGDRGHPILVAVSDRRHRPTGKPGGHVCLYHHTGAIVEFTPEGDAVVTPAPGRQVLLGGAGATDPVSLTSELTALRNWAATHVHSGVTAGAATSGAPAAPPPTASGATKVRAE